MIKYYKILYNILNNNIKKFVLIFMKFLIQSIKYSFLYLYHYIMVFKKITLYKFY